MRNLKIYTDLKPRQTLFDYILLISVFTVKQSLPMNQRENLQVTQTTLTLLSSLRKSAKYERILFI